MGDFFDFISLVEPLLLGLLCESSFDPLIENLS